VSQYLASVDVAGISDDGGSLTGTFSDAAQNLQMGRSAFGLARIGQRLHAFGGEANGGALADYETADLSNEVLGAWRGPTPINPGRYDVASIVIRNRVYMIGGTQALKRVDVATIQ
jgi:hypothetical protein